MSFKNLRIGSRVALSFASVIGLIAAVAASTHLLQNRIAAHVNEQATQQLERTSLALEWRQNIAVNGQRTLAIALSADKSLTKQFESDMKQVSTRTAELQKRFAELETTPAGKQLQDELAAMRKQAFAGREAVLAANAAGDAAASLAAAQQYRQTINDYIGVADRLAKYEGVRSEQLAAETQAAVALTQQATLGAAVISAAIAVVLGWLLTRSVVRPLASAQAAADAVAAGDLSKQFDVDRRDEIGQLQQSLAGMQVSLQGLVTGIRASAESIDVASDEVAAGNEDLSVRTEQAASRLQETASAMEELATTVQSSLEATRQATGLARSAREAADHSGRAVADVVTAMHSISESSKRIADITSVIDGIAFQTNILALNAAVEAARAGEQGRGFAVVAAEVRALAQRSSAAAKEIKELVTASMTTVEDGSRHASAAGAQMEEVTRTFQRVDSVVSEIAVASAEQAQGVASVNKAVAELDQTTQQNAALVEESAAAAKSLRDQAAALTTAVQRFQVAS